EEVERADVVPRLDAHDALAVRLRLRRIEAPLAGLRRDHVRALRLETVRDLVADLLRVAVAEHVAHEGDAAHARELHANGLEDRAPADHRTLVAILDLFFQHRIRLLPKPRVLPMPVRDDDRGMF